MTIPDWWQAVLLVLAAYRLTRLGGWDEWPPVAKLRARLIGERWVPKDADVGADLDSLEFEDEPRLSIEERLHHSPDPGLPGKQPASPVAGVRPAYDRPTLAHLTHCPWCLGFWVSLAIWGLWVGLGDVAVFAATPFAFSTAVGLIGRNLDA